MKPVQVSVIIPEDMSMVEALAKCAAVLDDTIHAQMKRWSFVREDFAVYGPRVQPENACTILTYRVVFEPASPVYKPDAWRGEAHCVAY